MADNHKSIEYLERGITASAMASEEGRQAVKENAHQRMMGYAVSMDRILRIGVHRCSPDQKHMMRNTAEGLIACGDVDVEERARLILAIIDGKADRFISFHQVIADVEGMYWKVQHERCEAALKAGGDVNERDAQGDTPLHIAVLRQQGAIQDYLLTHGAKINAVNAVGKTPLDLIFGVGYSSEKAVEYLRSKGGKHASELPERLRRFDPTSASGGAEKRWWEFWK